MCDPLWELTTLPKNWIKAKKLHRVVEFSQSHWVKLYVEFNTQKRTEAEKNCDKDRKALHKLMNNAVYEKTMETYRIESI